MGINSNSYVKELAKVLVRVLLGDLASLLEVSTNGGFVARNYEDGLNLCLARLQEGLDGGENLGNSVRATSVQVVDDDDDTISRDAIHQLFELLFEEIRRANTLPGCVPLSDHDDPAQFAAEREQGPDNQRSQDVFIGTACLQEREYSKR